MTNEELVLKIRANENVTENLEQLYRQNLPMIHKIAGRFEGLESHEDLVQEGFFGLCRAVELWDPDQETSFINYATYWLRSAMHRYIYNNGNVIRVPTYQREMIYQYGKLTNSYRVRFGRDPEPLEVMVALELSREQYEQLLKDLNAVKVGSTSAPVGEDGESTLEDFIPDEGDQMEEVIERIHREELARALWSEVDQLSPREASVIHNRFQNGHTLAECGEVLGVTAERVRSIQEGALRKLRRPKIARRLNSYLTTSAAYSRGIRSGYQAYKETGASAQERIMMLLEEKTGPIWHNTLRELYDQSKET